jgi:hypothetical protein
VLARTIVVLGGACKSCETTTTVIVVWNQNYWSNQDYTPLSKFISTLKRS